MDRWKWEVNTKLVSCILFICLSVCHLFLFCLFFETPFLCLIVLAVEELASLDQAGLDPSQSSACSAFLVLGVKVCTTTGPDKLVAFFQNKLYILEQLTAYVKAERVQRLSQPLT